MDGYRLLTCQSGAGTLLEWKLQAGTYNADIGPDWGIVELAGGIKLLWQFAEITGLAANIGAIRFFDVQFKKAFIENVYYVTAIGRDSAQGGLYQNSAEGSELSFGVRSQNKTGATFLASRVSGSNGGNERAGIIIQAIGK